jgi:hypothetical protein
MTTKKKPKGDHPWKNRQTKRQWDGLDELQADEAAEDTTELVDRSRSQRVDY